MSDPPCDIMRTFISIPNLFSESPRKHPSNLPLPETFFHRSIANLKNNLAVYVEVRIRGVNFIVSKSAA